SSPDRTPTPQNIVATKVSGNERNTPNNSGLCASADTPVDRISRGEGQRPRRGRLAHLSRLRRRRRALTLYLVGRATPWVARLLRRRRLRFRPATAASRRRSR